MVECCSNCRYCISIPRHNSYGDIDHLCRISGYYVIAINQDNNKKKHYTPGGRELECRFESRKGKSA